VKEPKPSVRGVTASRPRMQQILCPTAKQLSVGCVVQSVTTGTRYSAVEKQLQALRAAEDNKARRAVVRPIEA
jgi:hypothetical protein